jgi:hypothetical protein
MPDAAHQLAKERLGGIASPLVFFGVEIRHRAKPPWLQFSNLAALA